jgi:1,4-alpha-glucan branching enzyme
MKSESNGTYYVNIGNAQPGDSYVYQLQTPSGEIVRLDPRAQDIDPSVTTGWRYSVVHDPSFEWSSSEFSPPAPNQLVIYELHLPTFNVESGSIGTFDSAIKKLPYLQSLGVNAIELMPVGKYFRQEEEGKEEGKKEREEEGGKKRKKKANFY